MLWTCLSTAGSRPSPAHKDIGIRAHLSLGSKGAGTCLCKANSVHRSAHLEEAADRAGASLRTLGASCRQPSTRLLERCLAQGQQSTAAGLSTVSQVSKEVLEVPFARHRKFKSFAFQAVFIFL